MSDIIYPNKEDYKGNFWKNNYNVWLTAQGIHYKVNADCAQDALDYIMDYNIENRHVGLYMSNEQVQELTENGFIDDYCIAGNRCMYFSTYHIRIERI